MNNLNDYKHWAEKITIGEKKILDGCFINHRKLKSQYTNSTPNVIEFYFLVGRKVKFHRLDGPARIWNSGITEYWICGDAFTEKDFWNHPLVIKHKLNKIVEL